MSKLTSWNRLAELTYVIKLIKHEVRPSIIATMVTLRAKTIQVMWREHYGESPPPGMLPSVDGLLKTRNDVIVASIFLLIYIRYGGRYIQDSVNMQAVLCAAELVTDVSRSFDDGCILKINGTIGWIIAREYRSSTIDLMDCFRCGIKYLTTSRIQSCPACGADRGRDRRTKAGKPGSCRKRVVTGLVALICIVPTGPSLAVACTTRQQLLIDRNQVQTYVQGCNITTGRWTDQWTGRVIDVMPDARLVHVVPWTEAHISGGGSWPAAIRQEFLNDPANLLIVANPDMRPRLATPAKWVPVEANTACAYAAQWRVVKAQWRLLERLDEQTAINAVLAGCTATGPLYSR